MTTYDDVFGGANIYPSDVSWSRLELSESAELAWPQETSQSSNLATRIIDVAVTVPGSNVTLPPADKTSTGQTILFNNVGASTFIVYDNDGVQVVTLASGELWQVYLVDNSDAAGVWRSLQYGASISQANAASLAGSGLVAVSTLLAQSVPVLTFSAAYSAGPADRARLLNWTGSADTLTLPLPTAVGSNWFLHLRNSGSGAVTADPPGSVTIDGSATKVFQPGESATIVTDGINYFTVGYGRSAEFAFDYTVIDVAGTGNYTLAGSELNRVAYRFTGTLTGDRDVIVPATVQQYWVDNQTTGSFDLTVKTSGNPGQLIGQGQRAIYYCNGVDVVDADTSGVSTPLGVVDGGTGSTTAGGALINLGGTSIGTAIFTAADEAAVYAALGPAPSGIVDGGVF